MLHLPAAERRGDVDEALGAGRLVRIGVERAHRLMHRLLRQEAEVVAEERDADRLRARVEGLRVAAVRPVGTGGQQLVVVGLEPVAVGLVGDRVLDEGHRRAPVGLHLDLGDHREQRLVRGRGGGSARGVRARVVEDAVRTDRVRHPQHEVVLDQRGDVLVGEGRVAVAPVGEELRDRVEVADRHLAGVRELRAERGDRPAQDAGGEQVEGHLPRLGMLDARHLVRVEGSGRRRGVDEERHHDLHGRRASVRPVRRCERRHQREVDVDGGVAHHTLRRPVELGQAAGALAHTPLEVERRGGARAVASALLAELERPVGRGARGDPPRRRAVRADREREVEAGREREADREEEDGQRRRHLDAYRQLHLDRLVRLDRQGHRRVRRQAQARLDDHEVDDAPRLADDRDRALDVVVQVGGLRAVGGVEPAQHALDRALDRDRHAAGDRPRLERASDAHREPDAEHDHRREAAVGRHRHAVGGRAVEHSEVEAAAADEVTGLHGERAAVVGSLREAEVETEVAVRVDVDGHDRQRHRDGAELQVAHRGRQRELDVVEPDRVRDLLVEDLELQARELLHPLARQADAEAVQARVDEHAGDRHGAHHGEVGADQPAAVAAELERRQRGERVRVALDGREVLLQRVDRVGHAGEARRPAHRDALAEREEAEVEQRLALARRRRRRLVEHVPRERGILVAVLRAEERALDVDHEARGAGVLGVCEPDRVELDDPEVDVELVADADRARGQVDLEREPVERELVEHVPRRGEPEPGLVLGEGDEEADDVAEAHAAQVGAQDLLVLGVRRDDAGELRAAVADREGERLVALHAEAVDDAERELVHLELTARRSRRRLVARLLELQAGLDVEVDAERGKLERPAQRAVERVVAPLGLERRGQAAQLDLAEVRGQRVGEPAAVERVDDRLQVVGLRVRHQGAAEPPAEPRAPVGGGEHPLEVQQLHPRRGLGGDRVGRVVEGERELQQVDAGRQVGPVRLEGRHELEAARTGPTLEHQLGDLDADARVDAREVLEQRVDRQLGGRVE